MFIPVKYRDIILPDPVYDDNGSFIIPRSREWFTFMYKLEINTCEARLKQAKEAELELERIREEEFQRICERTNIDGEVTRLRHIYPQAELRMQQHAKLFYSDVSDKHRQVLDHFADHLSNIVTKKYYFFYKLYVIMYKILILFTLFIYY
ncbi:unnamed protein product [Rhizophagus irregularis]|nr:unnamed protein product [Rhizophagus irregularis]